MNTSVIIAGIILLVVILFWLLMSYNGFVKLRNSVDEAFDTIDVFLKKRHGMVHNLAKTAKSYMPDRDIEVELVLDANESAQNAAGREEKISKEIELSEALSTLFVISEDHPDLLKNKNFFSVKRQMQKVEKDILQAGKFYNVIAKMMNTRVRALPSNMIAKLFRFKRQPVFEFLTSVSDEDR